MEEDTADELSGGRPSSCRGPSMALLPPARHPRLPWARVHQVVGPLPRLLLGVAFIGDVVSLPPPVCVRPPPGRALRRRSLK